MRQFPRPLLATCFLQACSTKTEFEVGHVLMTPTGIELVQIPSGTFTMGSPTTEPFREEDEPQHRVTLTHSFLLGKFEVTQTQWQALMGDNPSKFPTCGEQCPVDGISWLKAVEFANALSTKEGLEVCYTIAEETVTWPKGYDCLGYRIPTEAEWEYAARANGTTLYSGSDSIKEVAWYGQNSGKTPHPVGQLAPNAWGLYDLSGNLEEWCWDWYGTYPSGSVTDPLGSDQGPGRTHRGSDWLNLFPHASKIARRGFHSPRQRSYDFGLRIARTL